ncbi:unnamed protein product [Gongylonema pulchrum]|uniref:Transmembrane protein n=1 Tax=Gongylonema pulchrum TaxID=637853 RepID=A0A183EM33_9BILA|nr:unnamed protein product [Gongylonema pulchrum]
MNQSFYFELKEMQRRDMEEAERTGDSLRRAPQRAAAAAATTVGTAAARTAETFPAERGVETSDDFSHDTTVGSGDSSAAQRKAERSSRLTGSESSSWRLSLSRSTRFDVHDLRGKTAAATTSRFFALQNTVMMVCMVIAFVYAVAVVVWVDVGDAFEGVLVRKHTYEALDRKASSR